MKELSLESKSVAQTQKFASQLGARLKGDETFALNGELGAGKTHFVKGLVSGASIEDPVTSPTFVLQRIYKGSQFSINHYDAYRVDGRQLADIGALDWIGRSVNIIEWADRARELLPADTVWINLTQIDENTRLIEVSYPESRAYLFK